MRSARCAASVRNHGCKPTFAWPPEIPAARWPTRTAASSASTQWPLGRLALAIPSNVVADFLADRSSDAWLGVTLYPVQIPRPGQNRKTFGLVILEIEPAQSCRASVAAAGRYSARHRRQSLRLHRGFVSRSARRRPSHAAPGVPARRLRPRPPRHAATWPARSAANRPHEAPWPRDPRLHHRRISARRAAALENLFARAPASRRDSKSRARDSSTRSKS